MTKPLTLDWIISTLKKSGCNSKQTVIDRLEKADEVELISLANSVKETRVLKRIKNNKAI